MFVLRLLSLYSIEAAVACVLIMDLFFEEHRRDVMKIIFWNLLE